jgi:hypothetical protein
MALVIVATPAMGENVDHQVQISKQKVKKKKSCSGVGGHRRMCNQAEQRSA